MTAYAEKDRYTFQAGDYSPDDVFDLNFYGFAHISQYSNELESGYVPTDVYTLSELFLPSSKPPNIGEIAFTTDDAIPTLIGEYDVNVTRLLVLSKCALLEDGETTVAKTAMLRDQGSFRSNKAIADQQDGFLITGKTTLVVEQGIFLSTKNLSDQSDGIFKTNITCFPSSQATFISIEKCGITDDTSPVGSLLHVVMEQMTKVYPDKWVVPIDDSALTRHHYLEEKPLYDYPYVPPLTLNILLPTLAYYPDSVFVFRETSAGILPDPYDPSGTGLTFSFEAGAYSSDDAFKLKKPEVGLFPTGNAIGITTNNFCSNVEYATPFEYRLCVPVDDTMQPPNGTSPWIDLPPVDPPVDPPNGGTITVPIQDTYTMQNIISATLDDDLTVIELEQVTLRLDADSTAWTFDANLLDPDQIALVQQLPNGTAKILHITVNTNVWHVLVEKIIIGRVFEGRSVSITGRGISALMNSPYEKSTSVNVGSLLTVQQIAESMLIAGWTITWGAAIWNVDAGAYSYNDKTPLAALSDLAGEIGSMIVPSPDSQVIEIKPRYPVAPWNFDTVAVDVAIPDAAVISLTEEPTSSYLGDAVYIHGGEIGGELSLCRLNSNKGGTGAKTLPTLSNNLMTDATGIRALGQRVLAGQYAQPKIKSITTFMDEVTVPFINVGTYIGVTIDALETKGIVNAVSIKANRTTVEQTLTIGESTPNTWMMFTEMLPQDPLLVATMTSTDGVTSLMTLVDGGIVRVRGTGVATQKYYIRSGEIVSDAPAVTVLTDTVIPV